MLTLKQRFAPWNSNKNAKMIAELAEKVVAIEMFFAAFLCSIELIKSNELQCNKQLTDIKCGMIDLSL